MQRNTPAPRARSMAGAGWRKVDTMDDERLKKIKYLANCTFLPGSYPKRFVRDMANRPADYVPTIRQALYIDKLYYQYRKQIGAMYGQDKPEFIMPGEVME